jgi:hypothetical protein
MAKTLGIFHLPSIICRRSEARSMTNVKWKMENEQFDMPSALRGSL